MDEITKRLLGVYISDAEPTLYLSGQFQSPPQNFHNSEEVQIDIVRSEEDVSIAIQDLSTGYRMNSEDLYTSKGFKPPVHKEAGPINAFDLIKRNPGQNPFADPEFQGNALVRAFGMFRKVERKIRRAVELQASQVLQTGQVNLTDISGNPLYSIDYKPKASHFPTASTPWDDPTADPLADLQALANIIRADGLLDPNELTFGEQALELFLRNEEVQKQLDNRRMNVGEAAPERRGRGATFYGYVWIGNYRFEIWCYNGRYKDPVTGESRPFVDPGKVIMKARETRLDATFGAIPRIAPPDSRVLPYLPARMSNVEGGMDLFTNAWLSPDGEQLFVGAGARPLMIPTGIDEFGCLDVGI